MACSPPFLPSTLLQSHERACFAGGSRNTGASVLARLQALAEAEGRLEVHRAALEEAQEGLKCLEAAAKAHQKCVPLVSAFISHIDFVLPSWQCNTGGAQLHAIQDVHRAAIY